MDPSDVVSSRNDHVGPTQEMSNTHFSDGYFSDGDISGGDISDGDFSDGNFPLRPQAFVSLGELIPQPHIELEIYRSNTAMY